MRGNLSAQAGRSAGRLGSRTRKGYPPNDVRGAGSLASAAAHSRSSDGIRKGSRKDIADYLSISVETVSRSLSKLKRRKIITLAGCRSVKLVNRDILDYEPMALENYKSGGRMGKF
jgi:DNA invertase Pin-like site-specific DNA recombinase